MATELVSTTLGVVVKGGSGFIQTGPFGSQLHASDYVSEGVPVIMPVNLHGNRVDLTDIARITDEDAQRLSRHIVQKGDIIYSRRGDVTRKALITASESGMFCGTGCLLIRPGENIDARFLAYHLGSPMNQEWIIRHAVGATMPNLNTGILGDIPLNVPSPDEQKAIAHILGTLDDKIELNRQMNATLESMAQALFKSWFVDFDPVIDNALAAGHPIPEALRAKAEARKALGDKRKPLPEAIQKQFPSRFVFSEEMGWMPEGWGVIPLDGIAHYQNGLALQKFRPENEDEFLPVVKIAQLKKGFADGVEKASPKIKPECIIDDGDVVFSWSGSLMVDVWCGGRAALNQHLFKVTSDQYPKWLFYQYTKHHLQEFQRIAADKAVTMGHIKKEHLGQALCMAPSMELLKECSGEIGALMTKAISGRTENNKLEKLLSTLLPQILSGQMLISRLVNLAEGDR